VTFAYSELREYFENNHMKITLVFATGLQRSTDLVARGPS